ncbi:serine/threonine-protein kinase [Kitasatospora purpeofusca]|uniref:serine/threonine protein kinase n=1 Tax=Kitasatospora purpeofusca TaxID=67352 RepID=UPI00340DFA67
MVSNDHVIAGRYELVELISEGIGQVWVAHDRALDRTVALKLLDERELPAAAPSLFEREAETMLKLRHLRIPEIYDSGTGVDRHGRPIRYIAMEHISGLPVSHLIARMAPLPTIATAALADSIAEVLQGIHSAGVIHRDIKPSNIILDNSGNATLIDFGLSIISGRPDPIDGIAGTVRYMAPEQISEVPVDSSADIYSFGVILYQLLTGNVPFGDRASEFEMLRSKVNEPPEIPSILRADIPETLESLVMAMLDRHPHDRPRLSDIRNSLQPFLREYPDAKLGFDVVMREIEELPSDYSVPQVERTLTGSLASVSFVGSRWLGESLVGESRINNITGRRSPEDVRALRSQAALLWHGGRQRVREAESRILTTSDPFELDEEVEAAHDNIDSSLARLFMRLGPPPEPAASDFVNLGSDGGGARK